MQRSVTRAGASEGAGNYRTAHNNSALLAMRHADRVYRAAHAQCVRICVRGHASRENLYHLLSSLALATFYFLPTSRCVMSPQISMNAVRDLMSVMIMLSV